MLAGASHAEAANYPFCTIDPNVVQCIVPDKNFKYLAEVFQPPSVVPAVLKVTDIAGLIKGASEGAGLGNAFLSHIAAVDGIYHLVRAFDSDEVIHVDDSIDPIRDLETIQGELCAKDRETLSKVEGKEKERVRKEKGMARAADPPLSDTFKDAYSKCKKLIDSNTPVQTGDFSMGEVDLIRDWGLITTKPQIYVVNLSRRNFIRKASKWLPKIGTWVQEHGGGQIIPVSVEFEEELFHFKDDPENQKGVYIGFCRKTVDRHWSLYPLTLFVLILILSFTAVLAQASEEATKAGLKGPQANVRTMIPRLIRAGRQALCLQSFYTAGPKEVRAWTIMKGTAAPQAAGTIHTDFERGFIKAEVASFNDFKELHAGQASMAKIKDAGKYKQEGKSYVMQEGDIVVFMHNVTASKKK